MVIDWNEAPSAPGVRRGAARRVVSSDRTTVVHVDTDPDAPFDGVAHRHEHEQWVVVVAGTLRMRCSEIESELNAGDLAYVPSQEWHAATGVGTIGARYLEISAPPRLDLLAGSVVPSPMEFETTGPQPDTRTTAPASPMHGRTRPTRTNLEDSHAR